MSTTIPISHGLDVVFVFNTAVYKAKLYYCDRFYKVTRCCVVWI